MAQIKSQLLKNKKSYFLVKKYLHFCLACAILYKLSERTADAPLAQLDRVFDYESKGRGFESRGARQKKPWSNPGFLLFYELLCDILMYEQEKRTQQRKNTMVMKMKKKRIYSVKSILGGSDFYDENGQLIGYSVPGIGGGEDFYGVNGETGYSVDSVLGGQDLYGSDGQRAYTVPGVLGGMDIHGDVNGFTIDNPLGGDDIILDDNDP